ncbi:MAG: hypothetical protein DME86_03520 [Verrucomicrobia bacterium]|nr:MAG: hypothetical protein DME86_03520 [Verrucomicrobiota bacterium]
MICYNRIRVNPPSLPTQPKGAKPANIFAQVFFAITAAIIVIGIIVWLKTSYVANEHARTNLQNLIAHADTYLHLWNKHTSRVPTAPADASPSRSVSAKSAPLKSPVAVTSITPPRIPNIITLTKPVSITIPYGIIGLRIGTKVQLLSRTSDKVRVRHDGIDYEIPISATNLR